MATVVYTISDFENIKWANNSGFVLPATTIELINSLSEQVGSPNYVKTPSFTNNNEKPNYKKKRRPVDDIKTDDWQSIRSFQKTEFVKKDGIEKEIDGIRLLINKLTEKTYDKITEKLFDILDLLEETESDTTYINKIGHFIFTTATSNKFNSHIYATLASELKYRYKFMTSIIVDNITEFMTLFENMTFVSPDENYDKFCEMNIVNEKRRAMSLFLTSLYHTNVITLDFVFDNIKNIQNMIVNEENMKNSNKTTENEELVENLYILLTNISVPVLKSYSGWGEIYNNIVKIKTVDTKICLGISSKTKFKHMDILDKLK